MGRRFHAASGVPCGFDEDAFTAIMGRCNDQGGLFVTDKGFMAGLLTPSLICPGWVMAVELAWWSEDRKGIRLLHMFEEWARGNGANEIRMTTLSALPKAGAIMERVGYSSTEVSWSKVI